MAEGYVLLVIWAGTSLATNAMVAVLVWAGLSLNQAVMATGGIGVTTIGVVTLLRVGTP